MCWSAAADLTAGAVIAGIGAACVTRAAAGRPRALPLSALPVLLGAHQMVEAFVWRAGGGTGPATVAWAVIALPLLPLWVPLGVLCAAPPRARRRLLLPAAAGAATACVLAYTLATKTVTAEIRGHTMGYAIGLPHGPWLLTGYLLATVGALLMSGEGGLVLLGVLAGAGAAACAALWRLEFVSTWCAWAALCSAVLYGWLRTDRGCGPRTRFEPDSKAR
ncbi:DUF6629 family protein [Streptomyces beihaiensis]|uniref:Integral membrane protein n=1 Tax=Streptomyces beihaiensis TaxID=2984495 RepID=A0ABT3TWP2_9ACTN|nr:DUF6629 family protein [Streptomyces beihaiensis]MCX3061215.1 hypothetical protein [Streptomyces beihaiensis]